MGTKSTRNCRKMGISTTSVQITHFYELTLKFIIKIVLLALTNTRTNNINAEVVSNDMKKNSLGKVSEILINFREFNCSTGYLVFFMQYETNFIF